MGVYVKWVEMPKSCGNCFYDTRCDNWRIRNWGAPPPEDCPLVPILPHGDLVERNIILKKMRLRKWMVGRDSDPVNIVEDAPTVIPAEEG